MNYIFVDENASYTVSVYIGDGYTRHSGEKIKPDMYILLCKNSAFVRISKPAGQTGDHWR